ncbi:hypothetical protein PHK61_20195 [Actinomycetospora lutea]|uniref:hypothetical protein n=1 Tax=Actinomycetospora lutea TaxID=663604 RepID=UPI0023664B1C|nr:hypothetical protein [Actinomycetospora lutea]MDD7940749.1 hypothetical protein [Actinomycetospora lutea]
MTLVPLTRRPPRVAAEPLTMPMPRLTDVVHAVTATFGSTGWTLRFGPSGQQVVVDRLSEAHAAARRLVGAALGLPAAAVRIRITPDRATLAPLRRS